jgi:hypothetical protein
VQYTVNCVYAWTLHVQTGVFTILKECVGVATGSEGSRQEWITAERVFLQLCNLIISLPPLLQVELHPYLVQSDLVDFCKSRNITLTAYSPLGSPGRPKEL